MSRGSPRALPARTLFAWGLLLAACTPGGSLTVYAPASLTDAMEEAARVYARDRGERIDLRFEASGLLATEIEHGAPADLFISADILWFDALREKHLLRPETRRFLAWNRLVLVSPRSGPDLPEIRDVLPILERIAIGDPGSVPAGRYAVQALRNLGVYDDVKDRLVQTHDVRAALALVERGEVEAGIVYASDARASERVRVAFTFSEQTHDPIVYPAALTAGSPHPERARKFLAFLAGPEGRRIFRDRGFGGT